MLIPELRRRGKQIMLDQKYEPQSYLDLIGDEVINRGLLKWLKSWDETVFGNKKYKAKTREASEQNKSFYHKNTHDQKQKNNYWATKQLIDGTDLNIRDECESLRNRIPFLAGETGTCKTTLACVVARHCKYHPVVINLSSVKSVEELISLIKSETLTHNVNSMFSTIQQKGEFDIQTGHNLSQLGSIDVVGGKIAPALSVQTGGIDKANYKPTCLILDQIDGFFNDDFKAQWTLLNFLYRTRTSDSLEIEDLFKEDQKN